MNSQVKHQTSPYIFEVGAKPWQKLGSFVLAQDSSYFLNYSVNSLCSKHIVAEISIVLQLCHWTITTDFCFWSSHNPMAHCRCGNGGSLDMVVSTIINESGASNSKQWTNYIHWIGNWNRSWITLGDIYPCCGDHGSRIGCLTREIGWWEWMLASSQSSSMTSTLPQTIWNDATLLLLYSSGWWIAVDWVIDLLKMVIVFIPG